MTTNFRNPLWLIILIYGLVLLWACSCTPEYHLNKFVKKGGKIEPVTKTVTITDTIKGKDGRDSIIFREVPCVCPDPVVETRWKVRFDLKRFNDSLDNVRSLYRDSLRNARRSNKTAVRFDLKSKKQDRKADRGSLFWSWIGKRWWLLLIAGFLLRHFLPLIWRKIRR